MLHQTIEKLHALKLSAMADGLLAQSRQPGIEALDYGPTIWIGRASIRIGMECRGRDGGRA